MANRSRRGAKSEPLCCSHEAAARAGQSVLKGLRSANEHLGGKPYGGLVLVLLPWSPVWSYCRLACRGKGVPRGKSVFKFLGSVQVSRLSSQSVAASQCPLHFRVQRCWRLLRFRTLPPPVRKGPIGRSTPCV